MNKRGSVIDNVVWIVVSFLTIVILGFLVYMFQVVEVELNQIGEIGNGVNMSDITADTFGVVNPALVNWMPRIALIIILFSALSILIHNFLVKAHPVFFVTYFFMAIVGVIISAYISNQHALLLQNEVIGSTLQLFTGANFIMEWLPYFVAVISIFGAIFLFINFPKDTQGGVGV